uniref:Secreted protein n=1 Tax=Anopheles arabiensis TaxID=7173 RepID=A0A8W7M460_ANOAR
MISCRWLSFCCICSRLASSAERWSNSGRDSIPAGKPCYCSPSRRCKSSASCLSSAILATKRSRRWLLSWYTSSKNAVMRSGSCLA